MAMTAGRKLRRDLDAELRKAGTAQGHVLVWSAREVAAIDAAVQAADHVEVLLARFDIAAAGDPGDMSVAAALCKLSAEIRQHRRTIADMVARLEFGPGKAKSDRHVRSAQARWNREGHVMS